MARFKKIPQQNHEGKIVLGNGIVDSIVMLAVSELEFVELDSNVPRSKMKSNAVKVSFDKEGVNVEVAVKIHYSQSVSDMAFKIQEAIRHNVEAMTEYHIASVNVIVQDVTFGEKEVAVSNEN